MDLVKAYESIDPSTIELTTKEVIAHLEEKYGTHFDFGEERVVDFVVRPIVAALLMGEIGLKYASTAASVDAVANSAMSDQEKLAILRKYARNMGIEAEYKDWRSYYEAIVVHVRDNWTNLKTPLAFKIKEASNAQRIYVADKNSKEMMRNKLPMVQFPDYMNNDFERGHSNTRTFISTAVSRADVERYKKALQGGYIELPSMVDLYVAAPIVMQDIDIEAGTEKIELPADYYIAVHGNDIGVSTESHDFLYGIIKRPLLVVVPDNGEQRKITIVKYDIPELPEIEDLINTSDVLVKGMFPLYLDLTVIVEGEADEQAITSTINSFFDDYGKTINAIDVNAINAAISAYGRCLLSPMFTGELVVHPGLSIQQSAAFPLSAGDIKGKGFPMAQVSENTILPVVRNIRFSREN